MLGFLGFSSCGNFDRSTLASQPCTVLCSMSPMRYRRRTCIAYSKSKCGLMNPLQIKFIRQVYSTNISYQGLKGCLNQGFQTRRFFLNPGFGFRQRQNPGFGFRFGFIANHTRTRSAGIVRRSTQSSYKGRGLAHCTKWTGRRQWTRVQVKKKALRSV